MAANAKPKSKNKGQNNHYALLKCSYSAKCSGYLYAPFFNCSGGHRLCFTCVTFYRLTCPVCRATVSHQPDEELEKVAADLLVPCGFKSRGCHFQVPRSQLSAHQQLCGFGFKTCFSARCGWSGPVSELIGHMATTHKERVYYEPEVTFSTRQISSRRAGVDTVSFVTCDAGQFWVRFKFDEDEEQFYGAVQYLGPPQEAQKMSCEFEMLEKDDDGAVTGLKCLYTGPIYTEADSFDEIFDNEQCFTVCLDFAKYFEFDDVVRVVMRIKKP